jgi:hypothetical protein
MRGVEIIVVAAAAFEDEPERGSKESYDGYMDCARWGELDLA